ncbi:unnamed protein product [Caenorhabditis sp. 36 PRJEB53466]|nr:unnamed protein product [Caenorhabditis sp. 36 PRJEB53466]
MPTGAWNDFTDLPAEFLSYFGTISTLGQQNCFYSDVFVYFASTMDDLLLGACFISTLMNLIVIWTSMKLYYEKGDTLHLFIFNMTIGDAILTCIGRFATYYWMYSYLYSVMEEDIRMERSLEIQFVLLTIFMDGDRLSPINKIFYEGFIIVFCVVPIISSLFVSCYLYQLTSRKRRITSCIAPNSKTQHTLTSFAFIFATTLWTSFSLLPYRLVNLARIHMIVWPNLNCDAKQFIGWFTWAMLYLLILNPIVNPLITAFAYAPYRQIICSETTKSPFRKLQKYKRLILAEIKQNREKKVSKQMVFQIEIPADIMDMNYIIEHSRRAPLAKLPSVCSFESLMMPDDSRSTRF